MAMSLVAHKVMSWVHVAESAALLETQREAKVVGDRVGPLVAVAGDRVGPLVVGMCVGPLVVGKFVIDGTGDDVC